MARAIEILHKSDDKYDEFGQYVASELRQLPPIMQFRLKNEIQRSILKFQDENFHRLFDSDVGYLDQLEMP